MISRPSGRSVLAEVAVVGSSAEHAARAAASPGDGFPGDAVLLVLRTGRGWSVVAPGRSDDVGDLVEGMSLADLIAEEHGALVDPDRQTRRAARGTSEAADPDADPRDARLATLERTVAQLEHALAARVATERAIGVLAERRGTTPRAAFNELRSEARSQGRPVQELAREVLDGLNAVAAPAPAAAPDGAAAPLRPPHPRSPATAEGRS